MRSATHRRPPPASAPPASRPSRAVSLPTRSALTPHPPSPALAPHPSSSIRHDAVAAAAAAARSAAPAAPRCSAPGPRSRSAARPRQPPPPVPPASRFCPGNRDGGGARRGSERGSSGGRRGRGVALPQPEQRAAALLELARGVFIILHFYISLIYICWHGLGSRIRKPGRSSADLPKGPRQAGGGVFVISSIICR